MCFYILNAFRIGWILISSSILYFLLGVFDKGQLLQFVCNIVFASGFSGERNAVKWTFR